MKVSGSCELNECGQVVVKYDWSECMGLRGREQFLIEEEMCEAVYQSVRHLINDQLPQAHPS